MRNRRHILAAAALLPFCDGRSWRLFFVGEHCSIDQRGMEVAASSGVTAAVTAVG